MTDIIDELMRKGWEFVHQDSEDLVLLRRDIGESRVSMTLLNEADMGEVHLHRIRSIPERKGGGQRAMNELCEAADKAGVNITLKVRPFSSMAMTEGQLEAFYAKAGFEPDPYSSDYSAMIRFRQEPDSSPEP